MTPGEIFEAAQRILDNAPEIKNEELFGVRGGLGGVEEVYWGRFEEIKMVGDFLMENGVAVDEYPFYGPTRGGWDPAEMQAKMKRFSWSIVAYSSTDT